MSNLLKHARSCKRGARHSSRAEQTANGRNTRAGTPPTPPTLPIVVDCQPLSPQPPWLLTEEVTLRDKNKRLSEKLAVSRRASGRRKQMNIKNRKEIKRLKAKLKAALNIDKQIE